LTRRANVRFRCVISSYAQSHRAARQILKVLVEALGSVGAKNGAFLAEFVEAGLDGTSSYQVWRELMITNDYPHVSQWRAQATEQGIEQGSVGTRVADILRILSRRDISVSAEGRTAIESCTDMDALETWFDRALVIDGINDLFAA
jgi:hypothetical protein